MATLSIGGINGATKTKDLMATLNEGQLMTNEKQVAAALIDEKMYGETSNEVIVDRFSFSLLLESKKIRCVESGAPDRRL